MDGTNFQISDTSPLPTDSQICILSLTSWSLNKKTTNIQSLEDMEAAHFSTISRNLCYKKLNRENDRSPCSDGLKPLGIIVI